MKPVAGAGILVKLGSDVLVYSITEMVNCKFRPSIKTWHSVVDMMAKMQQSTPMYGDVFYGIYPNAKK